MYRYAVFFVRQLREITFAIRQQEKPSQQGLKFPGSIQARSFWERASLFQNILLLLYTILLLLQFLMKSLNRPFTRSHVRHTGAPKR